MLWTYQQPVGIHFGIGVRGGLPPLVRELGQRPVLVSDRGLRTALAAVLCTAIRSCEQ